MIATEESRVQFNRLSVIIKFFFEDERRTLRDELSDSWKVRVAAKW